MLALCPPASALEYRPVFHEPPPCFFNLLRIGRSTDEGRLGRVNDYHRFHWMYEECCRRSEGHPFFAKDTIARNVGAVAFSMSIASLTEHGLGSHGSELSIKRAKIIVFTKLWSRASWKRIAFVFNRDHSSIVAAYNSVVVEVAPLLSDFIEIKSAPCPIPLPSRNSTL